MTEARWIHGCYWPPKRRTSLRHAYICARVRSRTPAQRRGESPLRVTRRRSEKARFGSSVSITRHTHSLHTRDARHSDAIGAVHLSLPSLLPSCPFFGSYDDRRLNLRFHRVAAKKTLRGFSLDDLRHAVTPPGEDVSPSRLSLVVPRGSRLHPRICLPTRRGRPFQTGCCVAIVGAHGATRAADSGPHPSRRTCGCHSRKR